MFRMCCLMEDQPSSRRGLKSEHGLSLLIEHDGEKYLFDTGNTGLFLWNAERLGISLNDVKAVILSHSHYDHAGGFRELLRNDPDINTLYTGPGFFEKKYSKRDAVKMTDSSAGFNEVELRQNGVFHHEVDGMKEIADGMWLFSDFDRDHAFETVPDRFVKEKDGEMVHDDFSDEICLAVDTPRGLVLIAGCSHPGILNMASTVRKRTGKDIYAVFGGTHLVEADEARVEQTVAELANMGVKVMGLSHCSGEKAEALIRERHPEMYTHLGPGDVVFI